ncbi:hypothetical protein NA56DRAFT_185954 [Hyaloscypha hepaticicola]|uniref:Uncharacterized protein n=1 Tax=Hyaloscypha hepaticicola TaxID=2082293 RepID=A0A2J6Q1I6_9HELO|nr:hypothetical protein NA56DRAFT_185954 [Hyaloscypha hepaticicola]
MACSMACSIPTTPALPELVLAASCRATEYAFEVHTRSLACPHLMSFLYPVPTFQKDVLRRLSSATTLALVGVGLVNSVEVGTEADLARTHLCDHGADRSVCVFVDFEPKSVDIVGEFS